MTKPLSERLDSPEAIRWMGRACLWAGLLGAAAGILLMAVPPTVPPERFSYPFDVGGFTVLQLLFAVQHVGLLAGMAALWSAVRSRRVGRYGLYAAIGGMALLTATEVAAIGAARANYPSPQTAPLDAAYGLSTLLAGAGMVAAGIAIARAGRWDGWRRYLPLAVGAYVFVPMMPMMFGPYMLARLAITGWMLLFAALGWVLAKKG